MLPWHEVLIRLLLASLFGALIGLERERKNWAAGLRTHMMVCVGSSLIMMVSAFGFADILGTDHVVLDPSRVAAQVVSGIGFIGAGAILFLKDGVVRGLTTAAGLWTVAAIGLATGGGMYFAATATTLIALIILWALNPLDRYFFRKFNYKTLRIITVPDADYGVLLSKLHAEHGLRIHSMSIEKEEDDNIILIRFSNLELNRLDAILNNLKAAGSVKAVSWQQ